jgi:molybdopterin-guanine dinucleotide biosynthesis protein MobB
VTPGARLLGLVLAGGGSRRFGRPKADARLEGLTLVERAARTLRPVCEEVVVGRAPELPDHRPGGEGPLAGIETGLLRADAEGFDAVVVLACDLPVVHTATIARLIEAWRAVPTPRRTVAVPDDPLQPLCGVWGVETRTAVSGALDAGDRSAVAWLRRWRAVQRVAAADLADELGLGPGELLANVNVPEAMADVRGLPLPPIVAVAGWKNSGKTTVAVGLIAELVARGYDVAALKHGHGFQVDREGTDSWRLRHVGGARRVLMTGPDGMALIGGWRHAERSLASLVRRHCRDADVVVAEGWRRGPWPTIEVRSGEGEEPLHRPVADDYARFLAVVVGDADAGTAGGPDAPAQAARVLHVGRRDPRCARLLADRLEARLL